MFVIALVCGLAVCPAYKLPTDDHGQQLQFPSLIACGRYADILAHRQPLPAGASLVCKHAP